MSSVQAPAPVNTGTALFIAAGAMAIIWAWAASKGGYISRDSLKYVLHLSASLAVLVAALLTSFPLAANHTNRILTVVIITLIIETWLLWLCCWMHQWHPLIYPEWHSEEEAR